MKTNSSSITFFRSTMFWTTTFFGQEMQRPPEHLTIRQIYANYFRKHFFVRFDDILLRKRAREHSFYARLNLRKIFFGGTSEVISSQGLHFNSSTRQLETFTCNFLKQQQQLWYSKHSLRFLRQNYLNTFTIIGGSSRLFGVGSPVDLWFNRRDLRTSWGEKFWRQRYTSSVQYSSGTFGFKKQSPRVKLARSRSDFTKLNDDALKYDDVSLWRRAGRYSVYKNFPFFARERVVYSSSVQQQNYSLIFNKTDSLNNLNRISITNTRDLAFFRIMRTPTSFEENSPFSLCVSDSVLILNYMCRMGFESTLNYQSLPCVAGDSATPQSLVANMGTRTTLTRSLASFLFIANLMALRTASCFLQHEINSAFIASKFFLRKFLWLKLVGLNLLVVQLPVDKCDHPLVNFKAFSHRYFWPVELILLRSFTVVIALRWTHVYLLKWQVNFKRILLRSTESLVCFSYIERLLLNFLGIFNEMLNIKTDDLIFAKNWSRSFAARSSFYRSHLPLVAAPKPGRLYSVLLDPLINAVQSSISFQAFQSSSLWLAFREGLFAQRYAQLSLVTYYGAVKRWFLQPLLVIGSSPTKAVGRLHLTPLNVLDSVISHVKSFQVSSNLYTLFSANRFNRVNAISLDNQNLYLNKLVRWDLLVLGLSGEQREFFSFLSPVFRFNSYLNNMKSLGILRGERLVSRRFSPRKKSTALFEDPFFDSISESLLLSKPAYLKHGTLVAGGVSGVSIMALLPISPLNLTAFRLSSHDSDFMPTIYEDRFINFDWFFFSRTLQLQGLTETLLGSSTTLFLEKKRVWLRLQKYDSNYDSSWSDIVLRASIHDSFYDLW